ncbi:MAG: hypothetical protein MUP71_09365 [Candidatus Aminicenantes bacterium]|nr:hypothetical protein [Candidatus Aminicenantes bacterium]
MNKVHAIAGEFRQLKRWRWPWNEMIERACGEKLTAKYYARQFVGVAAKTR